ncbi:MAG: hypothetical protein ACE10K_05390, partial [Rhodothermales bacterium]
VGHPKNRRLFVQTAHGQPSQVVRFSPKLNNQNHAMKEPKTVRMIARVTFTNKEHEGQVRRRSAFFTTERRATDLEKQGHAHRAPVAVPPVVASHRGPSTTKPAGPKLTKPAASTVKKASPKPEGPLALGYFTTLTLKAELKRLRVFHKSGESKKVLYERYLTHFVDEVA